MLTLIPNKFIIGIVITDKQIVYSWSIQHPNNLQLVDMNNQFTEVCCGGSHVLLLNKNNKVWSYGISKYGQTGHENQEKIEKPKLIDSIKDSFFKVISCGDNHSLLINNDGILFTFGSNNCG